MTVTGKAQKNEMREITSIALGLKSGSKTMTEYLWLDWGEYHNSETTIDIKPLYRSLHPTTFMITIYGDITIGIVTAMTW